MHRNTTCIPFAIYFFCFFFFLFFFPFISLHEASLLSLPFFKNNKTRKQTNPLSLLFIFLSQFAWNFAFLPYTVHSLSSSIWVPYVFLRFFSKQFISFSYLSPFPFFFFIFVDRLLDAYPPTVGLLFVEADSFFMFKSAS